MQSGLIAFVTAAVLLVLGKVADDWSKRREAKRAAPMLESKDQRDDEAGTIALARFHREEGEKLLLVIQQLRTEIEQQRVTMQGQIDALKKVNQGQAQEIFELRGQIRDLQHNRTRQTIEGNRQTRESERQTVEGKRLDQVQRDIEEAQ